MYDADGHYDAPLGQTASRDYHHHQALPDDDDEPSPAPTADDSFEAPKFKLNSASPASELPKSWAEWNWAYQNGLIDFNDPPPPPTDLWASDFVTPSGTFKPPRPANEAARQRAVDNLGVLPPARKNIAPLSERNGAAPIREPPPPSATAKNVTPAKRTQRQNGPLHPALQQLAAEAKLRFGVDATTISLMDNDQQVFLGDSSCKFIENTDHLERDSTCCAHTMLKASTTNTHEPLVVLDFAQDWRFRRNGFAPYDKGFYAAAPIRVPAPLGDDEVEYPAGIFCLLGEKPRRSFDEQDRRDLAAMAERASAEIRRYVEEQRKLRKGSLAERRSGWRLNDKIRKAARQRTAASPLGAATPLAPASDLSDEGSDPGQERSVKRDPLNGTAAAIPAIKSTSYPPISYGAGEPADWRGVQPSTSSDFEPEINDALDLSAELVSSSIDMDYTYLAAVRSSRTAGSTDGSMRLVASYGLAGPRPKFSPEAHARAAHVDDGVVLFARTEPAPLTRSAQGNEFTTGLLAHITTSGGSDYVLGCFSQDRRRVLNAEDVEFVRAIARDLVQYVRAGPSA